MGRYGVAWPYETALPCPMSQPRSRCVCMTSQTSRDLPTPGSPTIATTWPWPAAARASAWRICASSGPRPTRGVRVRPPTSNPGRSRSDHHPVPGHHVVSRRLQSEAALDETGGGCVEDDAVRPRLLQERGHRRPRLAPSAGIEAGGGATCRHQVSAEMDGAASAQPAKARVVPRTECPNHGPCGVDGPSRAVLHRADAEHGHEPHRREVLDPRPEARHLADQPLQHHGASWKDAVPSGASSCTRQDRDQALLPADARRRPRRVQARAEPPPLPGSASPGGSSAAASRRLSPCFAIR